MKYINSRWKYQGKSILFDLLLSETDVNGMAVYSQMFEEGICYRLFKPSDMIEVDDSQE